MARANEGAIRRQPFSEAAPKRWAAAWAVAALFAGIGFAKWLEHRHTSCWIGRLYACEVIVRAPGSGRVSECLAATGTVTENGKTLAKLEDQSNQRRRGEAEQKVTDLEQELAQAIARGDVDLKWRLQAIETDRHATQLKQAALLQEKFDNELRQRSLEERIGQPGKGDEGAAAEIAPTTFIAAKFASTDSRPQDVVEWRLQREAALNAVEVAAAQIALCDQRLERLRELADSLPGAVRRAAGVDSLEKRLEEARRSAEEAAQSPDALDVIASDFGTVGPWKKRPGDEVGEGEPLVTLFDEDRRYIVAWVPSQQLDLFAEGTQVALKFPGNVKRKGVVAPLPRQTTGASIDTASENAVAPGMAAVRIDAVDRLWPDAPIGSSIEVRVAK